MLRLQVELQQRDEQLSAMRHAVGAAGGASGAAGGSLSDGSLGEARGVAALAEVERSVAAIEYAMRRRGLCRAQPPGDGGGGGVGRGSGGAACAAANVAATAASAGRARLSSKDGKDKKAMGWVADMWQRGTSVLQQAPRAKLLASAAPLPPGFRCNNPHALATTPTPLPQPPRSPLPQPPRSPEPLPSPQPLTRSLINSPGAEERGGRRRRQC